MLIDEPSGVSPEEMTMPVTVELPKDVEEQLRADWPELERHALEGLVVEAYRQKKIGAHSVGRILGFTDRWDTINFLSERGIYPNYGADDFEEDIKTLEKLGLMPNR